MRVTTAHLLEDGTIPRHKNGNKQFQTADLRLNNDILQLQNENEPENVFNSMSRKRGSSLLSNAKTAKMKHKPPTPRVKLSMQSEMQKRKQTRRYSDDYVQVLKKKTE